MANKTKVIEVRTAEGQLIFSFHLIEKEGNPQSQSETSTGKRAESKSETQPGNGSQNGEPMSEAQRRYLFRILADQGIEGNSAFSRLQSLFNVTTLKDVTKREASKMISSLLEEQGGAGDGPPF